MAHIRYNTKVDLSEFGKLSILEKVHLQKMAQKYFRVAGSLENTYYIVRKKIKRTSDNVKAYKVLLAEFNCTEHGCIVTPRITSIITDAKDNIQYVLKAKGFKDLRGKQISINNNDFLNFGPYNEVFKSDYEFERY